MTELLAAPRCLRRPRLRLGDLRRWLQQHVFKVGWLLTKNLQTTTILFYTLFLPGVILNQFVTWMAAGILNVRAERAIRGPKDKPSPNCGSISSGWRATRPG